MSEGQLNHRLRACTRCVHDLYSSLPCGFEVDVVNAYACSTDDLQSVTRCLQHLACQFGGATNDDGVKGFQSPGQQVVNADVLKHHLVACFFQTRNRFFVHPVGDGDPCHGLMETRRR